VKLFSLMKMEQENPSHHLNMKHTETENKCFPNETAC
jgi:hypothetical protein